MGTIFSKKEHTFARKLFAIQESYFKLLHKYRKEPSKGLSCMHSIYTTQFSAIPITSSTNIVTECNSKHKPNICHWLWAAYMFWIFNYCNQTEERACTFSWKFDIDRGSNNFVHKGCFEIFTPHTFRRSQWLLSNSAKHQSNHICI